VSKAINTYFLSRLACAKYDLKLYSSGLRGVVYELNTLSEVSQWVKTRAVGIRPRQ
jgi:hypothetical protein